MVVPVCLLPVPSVMDNARSHVDVPVLVDMNSLWSYPQLPGILLSECIRLRFQSSEGTGPAGVPDAAVLV